MTRAIRLHLHLRLSNPGVLPHFIRSKKKPALHFLGLLIALLIGLSAATAVAQTSSPAPVKAMTIQGTVKSSKGEAVAGAVVQLEGQGQPGFQQTKTSLDGKFMFPNLGSGLYTLTAEKEGVRSRPAEPIEIATGALTTVVLILDSAAPSATPGEMEFSDKPNFTVAGVTDWSGAGGHGSDTSLRTSEALARDTLALKPGATAGNAATSAIAKDADAHRVKGDELERSGDALGAVGEFERAAELDASERNYFAWGTELLLHRAVLPAEVVFRKGAAAHPTSARMLVGLGAALYAAGGYLEAASELCKASDLEPENKTPYLFLGKMEIASIEPLGCAPEALARFLQQQPNDALANYYFAMVLLQRARNSNDSAASLQAQKLLRKAIALEPGLGEAYLQLAIQYAAAGQTDRAISSYLNALKVSPQLSEAHYRLSQIYKRLGEKEKAEKEIQLYKLAEKNGAEAVERERREVQQFLIILKEPAS